MEVCAFPPTAEAGGSLRLVLMAEATQELSRKISCKFFKEDNLKGILSRIEVDDFFVDPSEESGEPRVGAKGEDIFPKAGKSFSVVDGEIEITIRKF